jgi:hypothetical protein
MQYNHHVKPDIISWPLGVEVIKGTRKGEGGHIPNPEHSYTRCVYARINKREVEVWRGAVRQIRGGG